MIVISVSLGVMLIAASLVSVFLTRRQKTNLIKGSIHLSHQVVGYLKRTRYITSAGVVVGTSCTLLAVPYIESWYARTVFLAFMIFMLCFIVSPAIWLFVREIRLRDVIEKVERQSSETYVAKEHDKHDLGD